MMIIKPYMVDHIASSLKIIINSMNLVTKKLSIDK